MSAFWFSLVKLETDVKIDSMNRAAGSYSAFIEDFLVYTSQVCELLTVFVQNIISVSDSFTQLIIEQYKCF